MKKEVMTRAWELYRMFGDRLTFAKCLKMSWATAKSRAIKGQAIDEIFANFEFSKVTLDHFTPSSWWKECEKRGIDDYTKRRGYAILKKEESYQESREKFSAYGW